MENHNLKKIAETYKSDKIEHGYIEIYESYFHKLKENNLIESEILLKITSKLIVNKISYKILNKDISKIINKFEKVING